LKTNTYISILLTIIILIFGQRSFSQKSSEKALFDLRNYNFNTSGEIELNGKWKFYPEKLYKPEQVIKKNDTEYVLVDVPGLWNNTYFKNKEKFNIGYGTYSLRVILPKQTELIALRLKRIESSYVLWINGDSILSCGIPATIKEKTIPAQKTLYTIYPVANDTLDIVLQVSNFHHRKGGIDNPVIIGTPLQIMNKTNSARGFEFFLIGVLLIMALFHFGLFAFKRKDFSLLFFGSLLVFEILSMITNGEVLITYYFPDLSWIILKKIDYISNFLRLIFFGLFFYKLYPKYLSLVYFKVITGINILMILIVLFTSLLNYAFTLPVFMILGAVTIIYVLFAQIKSIFKKDRGAVIPFIGVLIVLFTAVNDILYISDIINTIFLVPVGIFIFIFSQSYILSFNFSSLYKQTEELNKLTSDIDEIKNRLLQKNSFYLSDSLQTIAEFANGTRAILISISEQKSELKSVFPFSEINKQNDIYPEALINETIEKQKPFTINNPANNPLFTKEYLKTFPVKNALCLPLKAGDNVRAVLYIENSERRFVFDSHMVEVLTNISDQIIGTIDNIDKYNELKDLRANLESIIENRTKDLRNQNLMSEEQKTEIESINYQLNETLKTVSNKNKIITESIAFAKQLQNFILPDEKLFNKIFTDSFVLNRPKETISGDFYWVNNTDKDFSENPVCAIGDCTGHGVPGTLLSIIGSDLLNEVILNKKIKKPSEILDNIQIEIGKELSGDSLTEIRDGMELAVISYHKKENLIEYAGAGINFVIFRNGKMSEVNADNITISPFIHERLKDQKFTNYKIQVKPNDVIYLFSDGYQDQFGGAADTKFMKRNFRNLLEEINLSPFNIQRSRLLKTLNAWQGKNIQNDDILVLGFKI